MDLTRLGRAFIHRVEPEQAHNLALQSLRAGVARPDPGPDSPMLAQTLFGLDLKAPVGVAAGFDKNGEVIAPVLRLGVGFVEIGGVTPRPQPGNPQPRVFRLVKDQALINRLGFNNEGAEAVAARLAAFRRDRKHQGAVVGVNLGINKDSTDPVADYADVAGTMGLHADFVVVNVSSPNTPGLRALQDPTHLRAILDSVSAAVADSPRAPRMLVKVAPDLVAEDRRALAGMVMEQGNVAGLVVGNTTISRPGGLSDPQQAEAGGLSGTPLLPLSNEVLADFRRLTQGRLPLIGVGGVMNGHDAYTKIRLGASAVQLYTGLVFEGMGVIGRIKRELITLLQADGFAHVSEAVGVDVPVE